MTKVDIKRILTDYGITQKRLCEITKYNQGFVSLMKNGKVGAPEMFLERLQFGLDIPDIRIYLIDDAEDQSNMSNTEGPSFYGMEELTEVEKNGESVEKKLLSIIEAQQQVITMLMKKISVLENK